MIDIRLLTALNVADSDDKLLDVINGLGDMLEAGTIRAECDGDAITSLHLTPLGKAMLPMLPPTFVGDERIEPAALPEK